MGFLGILSVGCVGCSGRLEGWNVDFDILWLEGLAQYLMVKNLKELSFGNRW